MLQSGLKMDIRKWLAETEDPISFKRRATESCLFADHVADARRSRKRTSSDSSLLKQLSSQPCGEGIPKLKRIDNDIHNVGDSGQSKSAQSTSGVSTESSASSQCFARKRRHKTRPDKYDGRLKSSRKQKDARIRHRREAANKSKRRPKRRIDAKTHNRIGLEFRAENVSKDRLTLKPTDSAGLFGKGKTSGPVRGRGLPDLVFSDMKFLQKGDDEREKAGQASQAKMRRKKDTSRTKEEDISAFFSSTRPALAETYGNTPLRGGPPPLGSSFQERAARRSRVSKEPDELDAAVRTGESEGKTSTPGTNNRRPTHETTSYFSWSEPVRPPSAASASALAKAPLPASRRQLGNLNKEAIAEWQHRYTIRQQPPSWAEGDNAKISINPIEPRSPASNVSRHSRPSSSPPHSAFPSRLRLVTRAGYPHMTEADALSSTALPGLRIGATEDQATVLVTERERGASLGDKLAPWASRQAPTVVSDAPMSYGIPHLRVSSGKVPLHADMQAAEVPRISPLTAHCVIDHTIDPSSEVGRQPEGLSYRGCARTPAVQFNVPNVQVYKIPNLLSPGLYLQQEQQQQQQQSLKVDIEKEYDYPLADTAYEGYVCEGNMSDQEDLDDVSDGLVPDTPIHEIDAGYGGDVAEQASARRHSDVVGPRFWRPRRMY